MATGFSLTASQGAASLDGTPRGKQPSGGSAMKAGFRTLTSAAAAAALLIGLGIASAGAADSVLVGLITKTDTNPFFVKMREGAAAKAKEIGITLQTFAGKYDGYN